MPVDSPKKRRSAMGADGEWQIVHPIPDGVIDEDDKRQEAGLYAGLETPEPPEPQFIRVFVVGGGATEEIWDEMEEKRKRRKKQNALVLGMAMSVGVL